MIDTMLSKLGACSEAREWVADHSDSTLLELWSYCYRADWMLWLSLQMAGQAGWPAKDHVIRICNDVLSIVHDYRISRKASDCDDFKTSRCPCRDWSDCMKRARSKSGQERAPEAAFKKFPPHVDFHAIHAYGVYRRASHDDRIRMADIVRMRLRPGPIPEELGK